MRAGVISMGMFGVEVEPRTAQAVESSPMEVVARPASGWNPEKFAQEQVRNLVRRVFLQTSVRPVRQVIFSSVAPQTDVRDICERVGEVLAAETLLEVAVVADHAGSASGSLEARQHCQKSGESPLREIGRRVRDNLWMIPLDASDDETPRAISLHKRLGEIRREFEYSIVAGALGGGWNEVCAAAQFADGIILVVSAQFTRRVTAQKVRAALESAHVRLLGTVLSDREFPIPEALYRRL